MSWTRMSKNCTAGPPLTWFFATLGVLEEFVLQTHLSKSGFSKFRNPLNAGTLYKEK